MKRIVHKHRMIFLAASLALLLMTIAPVRRAAACVFCTSNLMLFDGELPGGG
jgi:hypothetical protein